MWRAFWRARSLRPVLGLAGNGPPSFKIGRRRKYKPCEVEEWAEDQREERSKRGRSREAVQHRVETDDQVLGQEVVATKSHRQEVVRSDTEQ